MPAGSKQRLKYRYCNMPASLVKLLYRHNCLVSDMSVDPVPHNQTWVMVIMSADPVAMMPGQLVDRSRTYMHTCRM